LHKAGADGFFGAKQRLDFGPQGIVRRTGLIEETGTLLLREPHDFVQKVLDVVPLLQLHGVGGDDGVRLI
jgi:hypothetical protein